MRHDLNDSPPRVTALRGGNGRAGRIAGLAGALALLGACTAAPLPPTAALDEARTAIASAERADAGRYAGADLSEARQNLALARDAAATEDMIRAEQLAVQARVGAELAVARTEAAKAQAVNQEMSRGAEALLEEMQRAGDQR